MYRSIYVSVIEEMCLRRDMWVSKITHKFLSGIAGSKKLPAIEKEDGDNLECCVGVPIIIYSVLDRFRHRRLFLNQVWTRSSVDEICEKGEWDLVC